MKSWLMEMSASSRWFALASLALLLLALTLGGASRDNTFLVLGLEIAALAFLPWVLHRITLRQEWSLLCWPLVIVALLIALPLIQLAPLPPSVWMALPGREQVVEVYRAAGLELGWFAMSVAPARTLSSSLSLIVPVTVFLSWTTLATEIRRTGLLLILTVMLLGLLLGAVQLAGGGSDLGYLYSNTNHGALVGFFSNRNHEAALLFCSLPLAAALVTSQSRPLRPVFVLVLFGSIALIVALALIAVQSRAGIILLGPALVASVFIIVSSGRVGSLGPLILVGSGVVAALLAVLLFLGIDPITRQFDDAILNDTRFLAAPEIWKASLANMPFGTGLGSFANVYRSIEPLELVGPAYLNHAHNEYLELLLETGVLWLCGFVAFLGFIAVCAYRLVFRARDRSDTAYGRAALVIIALLLIHSAVDYPLRTVALASLFAFSCALLIRPKGETGRAHVRKNGPRLSSPSDQRN